MSLPEPVEFHPGDIFFSKAEKMFQRKEYGNALEIYDKYLARFPDGYRAAQALMKKGLIHAALGEYGKSRTIYNRLIAKYPSSPVVSDARVEQPGNSSCGRRPGREFFQGSHSQNIHSCR